MTRSIRSRCLALGLLPALLLLSRPENAHAQAPGFQQAVTCAGGEGNYRWGPKKLAVDAVGNTYAAGVFNGTIALGTTVLVAAGTSAGPNLPAPADVFVAKLDAAGNYVWAIKASGDLADEVTGITVDGAGDVYVTGHFESYSLGFGGTTLFNSSARAEAYVAKLSGTTGQWLWARRAGGIGNDFPTAIAVSASGGVYIAGSSSSRTADFGAFTLVNSQSGDAFIAKLNVAGA